MKGSPDPALGGWVGDAERGPTLPPGASLGGRVGAEEGAALGGSGWEKSCCGQGRVGQDPALGRINSTIEKHTCFVPGLVKGGREPGSLSVKRFSHW